ncbi:TetR/AcrR family transcriptional regulator [Companilactobacillus kimchiensis]|uniref:HTH tetR-type domain-containing protein n=1 Tax=Companilactobacillus kimchiensis TaxID=993692 RepID=A0A0R2LGT6_9LACO|nr:TetR family transcriptional regulator [Companilactobacillus kimchiensis]KRN97965.1 hypothetical protein IV57_GL001371 [Companilactobacillus kimchiensis]
MANLQNQRTKKLIFMGFRELLAKESFSKITINEIADQAMIHRSTFYTHFTDKYDLLNQYLAHQRTNTEFNSEDIYEHPFSSIAEINNLELLPLLKFQSDDADFRNGFFQFVIDTVMENQDDKTELDKFFFIGRIKAINLWIDRTKQPYNPFVDYVYLDKVFRTGKK